MNRREMLRRFSALSAGGIATPALAQLDYLIRQPVSVVLPRANPIYAVVSHTSGNNFTLKLFGLNEKHEYNLTTGRHGDSVEVYVDSVEIPVKWLQLRQS